MPPTALDAALQTILSIGPEVSSRADQALEVIESACEELRRRTTFDTGTSCVNDQVPAMVPLLPPEEIWLDGRELPLDVWRLISFEFDLVSSGIAGAVDVPDFAFSAMNANALTFNLLIKQLRGRRAKFDLRHVDIPPGWETACIANPIMDVGLARLFFEAGCLLTPWAGDSNAQWFAAVRYAHWLETTSANLRVKDEFDDDSVDSRYRGIFAEETAVGMMAVVLNDVFGCGAINNTVEWIRTNRPELPKPNGLIADFITQAQHPATGMMTTIIAESKGSLGGSVSTTRRKRAKEQIAATNVAIQGSTATLPLAFCSSIRFAGQTARTQCEVNDPPVNEGEEPLMLDPVVGIRLAYAKALKFVGLQRAARQVIHGEPATAMPPMDYRYKEERSHSGRDNLRYRRAAIARERFGMELVLDAGVCAIGVDWQIANMLRQGLKEGAHHEIMRLLSQRQKVRRDRYQRGSFDGSLGLGCIFYEEIDE